MRSISGFFIMFVLTLFTYTPTLAAAYPEKSITLIVPFGAGGTTDSPARLVARMMEKKLRQPIIIKNVVGAGGAIGVAEMVVADPDGYTLGFVPTGTICLQPHVQETPYNKDSFTFLGLVMHQPVTLVSSKKAPWKNFEELVAAVKKDPNKYVVGTAGVANMTHVPMAALAKHFGLQFRYVPYRSSPELMKDLLAGRVVLYADTPVTLSQFDVMGLLQFSEARIPNLKDIPTTKEIGFNKVYSHWQGLIGPKGIPEDIVKTLGDIIRDVVISPEFIHEAARMSTNAHWMGPKDFQVMFEKDFVMYGEEIKELTPKK